MQHATALVETNDIGTDTNVWAYAHVMRGASVGNRCNIGDHAFVESGAIVGNNVTLKNNVCVWHGVTIEDDDFVGPSVTFTNDRNPRSPRMDAAAERYESQDKWLEKTLVGRGCSIGAAATICPGIKLGEYSMIAAGSVVTRDVPAYALVMGNPARIAAHVCTCGQKLSGPFDTTDCEHCGEKAIHRLQATSIKIS